MIRALVFLLVAQVALAPARAAEVFGGRPCMGTVLEITFEHPSPDRAHALLEAAFAEAARLDGILSNWRPETELSRFNAHAGQGPMQLSPELAEILELCVRMHDRTDGAFDVTLGPLIIASRTQPLDPKRMREALALVDAHGLTVHGREGALARRGMAVDLGGVGKGYAVDRLRDLLVRGGATAGFLDFGQSSQLAFGPKPRVVAVRDLSGKPGAPLTLFNSALSTSDSGREESSLLDPRTGALVPAHRQATATAPTGAEAEAWTKPLVILGRAWLEGPAGARLPGSVRYHDEQGTIARDR